VTLVVGQEQRIFAAHENVLAASPFFQAVLQNQMLDSQSKKISLPDEEPEIFSSVLEYLYKGDYYPRLLHNKKRNSYELEQHPEEARNEATVYHHTVEGELLKDTVIYCAAEKYGLDELKRVALRKQGLRMFQLIHNFLMLLTTSQNRESKPAPFLRPLGTHTPILLTPTPSYGHTTWLSSSAAAAPSSEVVPCSWRCTTEAHNCSLTSLSRFATTWTTSRLLRKYSVPLFFPA